MGKFYRLPNGDLREIKAGTRTVKAPEITLKDGKTFFPSTYETVNVFDTTMIAVKNDKTGVITFYKFSEAKIKSCYPITISPRNGKSYIKFIPVDEVKDV